MVGTFAECILFLLLDVDFSAVRLPVEVDVVPGFIAETKGFTKKKPAFIRVP